MFGLYFFLVFVSAICFLISFVSTIKGIVDRSTYKERLFWACVSMVVFLYCIMAVLLR
ncbi:hypothetical protein J27TS7_44690 [Paenibacillus dendritiformis]|nr:hypothetical protein J27TS7_44690 [Paenibacillus dendritiformis]SUA95858.1 Uncharacterised protein [Paenibacillus thiaminolyticus]